MLISELNRDQMSLMWDIIYGQININICTNQQRKTRKYLLDSFFGWVWLAGEVWCTWVDSLSHPAIYPLQRQERIEYIKICFTEITKIRKKLRAAIPNKGFFAAQSSGVESINPGENIVWVACAPLSYNSLTSAAASVTNINQNNSDKRCNKNS